MAFLGEESQWAAEASECAGDQGQFWQYHDKLFESQNGENQGAFNKDKLQGVRQGPRPEDGRVRPVSGFGQVHAEGAAGDPGGSATGRSEHAVVLRQRLARPAARCRSRSSTATSRRRRQARSRRPRRRRCPRARSSGSLIRSGRAATSTAASTWAIPRLRSSSWRSRTSRARTRPSICQVGRAEAQVGLHRQGPGALRRRSSLPAQRAEGCGSRCLCAGPAGQVLRVPQPAADASRPSGKRATMRRCRPTPRASAWTRRRSQRV